MAFIRVHPHMLRKRLHCRSTLIHRTMPFRLIHSIIKVRRPYSLGRCEVDSCPPHHAMRYQSLESYSSFSQSGRSRNNEQGLWLCSWMLQDASRSRPVSLHTRVLKRVSNSWQSRESFAFGYHGENVSADAIRVGVSYPN